MNKNSENIVKGPGFTAIMNGGDPLPGCPESWEQAYEIQARLNHGKEEGNEPMWRFDCGFKLDFDGPILSVSSRFYPPKTHYGSTWDGKLHINFMGKEIGVAEFNEKDLGELAKKVETFIVELSKKLIETGI